MAEQAPGAATSRRADAAFAGLAMLLALAVAVLAYRLWRADPSVPLAYPYGTDPRFTFTDTLFVQMIAQAVLDHGWYLSNPDLGAPFAQELHDFPVLSGDALQVIELKLLGHITGDAAAAMNLVHVISFPLAALTAYAALRLLHASRPAATACAVLYAVLPFHFVEAQSSITAASYYAVPLGCWLALATLRGEPLFERGRSLRTAAVVAGALLLVLAGSIYYAAFALMLLAVAAALGYAVSRRRAVLVHAAAVAAIVVGGLALANLPTIVYEARHGHNEAAAEREPQDSDYFSVTAFKLLMPMSDHRLEPLSRLSTGRQGAGDAKALTLGLGATAGLLFLLGIAASALAGARARPSEPAVRGRHAATLALTAFLIGTTGGASAMFAYLVDPQLRAWYRLAVVIGFFGLFGLALLLDRLAGRLGPRRRAAFLATCGAVVVLGALDQTSDRYVPAYARSADEFRTDAAFVRQVERRLPSGADVFQLPYVAFPEGQPGPVNVYNHLKGYVHSRRLRWSFGAMKGRPADWAATQRDERLEDVVAAVTAKGFEGLWIDRRRYGRELAGVEARLRRLLGAPALTSEHGAFAFYDLRRHGG